MSNYTTHIQSNLCNLVFLKDAKNTNAFAAYAKLKRDVKDKEPFDIDMKRLRYYQTNFKYRDLYADKIYNVDIKSAYASILFNDNVISKDSFDFLQRLPKMERLSSVGMLAGRKNVFEYKNGLIDSMQEIISPYSSFFFYAVKRMYDIVDEAKVMLGNDFVFSWVDGIYYTNPEKTEALMKMLEENFNLKSTYAELHHFDLVSMKDKYKLSYDKDGKHKFFYIPFPQHGVRQSIYNYLLTKSENYETGKIDFS